MTLCCAEEAERLLGRAGAQPRRLRASGDVLDAGTVFLEAERPAAALHGAWKVAQTLIEYASGIAATTRRMIDTARSVAPLATVACTRKVFPGTKAVAIKAVLAGGAEMHRLGLSETLMVFAEHRAFLDGGIEGFLGSIADLKRRFPERRLMAETVSADEAVHLAEAGVDVVQLERLTPEQVARVVERIGRCAPGCTVAAAGGITEANIGAYAATGCPLLVTSAPYFARPADVKVTIDA